jgi:hypothetical protein
MDKQLVAIWAVFALAGWVAWLIFGAVRQVMAAKTQIALQDRLLHHVSSPQLLGVFLESAAGASCLRALERDPQHPWRQVIGGAQATLMFGVVGLGGLLSGIFWQKTDVMLPISYAAIVIAVALGAATGAAFHLYRRAGMLTSNQG